jgi:alcohol dehydrogenase class IV
MHDIPIIAVVDPEMMSSMPKGLTAATGMDALTHAIEGYITKGAWELSDMFHIKAIEPHLEEPARRRRTRRKDGARAWRWASMCRHGLLQRGTGRGPLHGAHAVRLL